MYSMGLVIDGDSRVNTTPSLIVQGEAHMARRAHASQIQKDTIGSVFLDNAHVSIREQIVFK